MTPPTRTRGAATEYVGAALIAWLCDDPAATPGFDRTAIKIWARIVGGLDLSHVRVPFALTMKRCLVPERIVLIGTEIPHLDFDGTYTTEINAEGLIVRGDLNLRDGFHASGEMRDLSAQKLMAHSSAPAAHSTIRRSRCRAMADMNDPPLSSTRLLSIRSRSRLWFPLGRSDNNAPG